MPLYVVGSGRQEQYLKSIAKANISHKNENFDAKLGIVRVDTDGFSAMTPKGEKAKKYEDDGLLEHE